jgi:hypothetical protein
VILECSLGKSAASASQVRKVSQDQPDTIPKKTWRKTPPHGKTNVPGLTAIESSDRDQLETERITTKGKARATTSEKR